MVCYNHRALHESRSGGRCFGFKISNFRSQIWNQTRTEGEESPNTTGQRAR